MPMMIADGTETTDEVLAQREPLLADRCLSRFMFGAGTRCVVELVTMRLRRSAMARRVRVVLPLDLGP
jgi:hypothetical protein